MSLVPMSGIAGVRTAGQGLVALAAARRAAESTSPEGQSPSSTVASENAGATDADTLEAQARRRAQTAYLAVYIETYGAPEEKEEDRVKEPPKNPDEDEEKKIRRSKLPSTILETRSQIEQDPDDEGKFTVYAVRLDADGKAHYSRAMEFDVTENDGETNRAAAPARDGSDRTQTSDAEGVEAATDDES